MKTLLATGFSHPTRFSFTKFRASALGAGLTLAILWSAHDLRADAPPTALHLSRPVADAEGMLNFRLSWNASSNATYLVQSATNLAPGAWQTVDVVTITNEAGALDIKGRSIPENSVAYFRLILPQPQIFSVEPAIVTPGVPVDFYVRGQCFPTNAELRIKNLPQSGTLYQSSSALVQPSFTPDVAGDYQFSLVVSGQVLSSFTVVCADALVSPELVLQGPPTMEPPASPVMDTHIVEEIEFVVEKVERSKARAAGGGGEPLDPDSDGDGVLLSRKGYEYYQAQSAATYEVQEGKKGINAVNVKLARTAGGPNGLPFALSIPGVTGGGGSDVGEPTATLLMPALMKAKEKANRTKCGNNLRSLGVQPFSGEVEECDVDLAIPGRGLDFIWARTYHSRIGRTGAATNGWTFSYDLSLQPLGGDILIHNGTGRADTFKQNTNGTYTCPEFFSEGTLSNDTFTLTFADGGRWVFYPFRFGAQGAASLTQIITRNGDTMTFGYDTSGRLAQVVDDLGRTNTMAYNTAGQLASVTDFTGRSVTYQYYQGLKGDAGSPGDLKSVISPPVTGTPNGNDFPGGKTNSYTYSQGSPLEQENHLLLTITDPTGQTTSVFTYGLNAADPTHYLRCNSAQCGAGKTERITVLPQLATSANHFAVQRCIVNDAEGYVAEYFYDARNRCVMERDYTGRATPELPVTDTLNRPTGKLRSSDPDYYETTWAWNNDSLCTRLALDSHQIQAVYESDLNPATPSRKRADCRVIREIAGSAVDLDGDGVADISERVWRFEHDPRFGTSEGRAWLGLKEYNPAKGYLAGDSAIYNSIADTTGTFNPSKWEDLARANMRTRINQLETRLNNLGLLSARSGNVGINEPLPFATLHAKADKVVGAANGNFAPLDASGNLSDGTLGRESAKVITDRDTGRSKGFGFVTSVTDPRGQVTQASFDAKGNVTQSARKNLQPGSLAVEDFVCDSHGQVTAITNAPDANGRRCVVAFSWAQGRMTECVVDAGAGGLALASSFEYDARGNLTRCVDARGNDSLFTYNALDQCVRTQSPVNLSARCATDLAYDANDNLVQISTQVRDGADALLGNRVNSFAYDALHRLIRAVRAVDATRSQTNDYVYDNNGRCVQALGPDAVSGADPHQMTAYVYDERGLLFRSTNAPGSSGELVKQVSYTPAGLRKSVQWEPHKTPGLDSPVIEYTYDGFDRLASATDPMGNVTTIHYDANDNPKVLRHYGETNDVPGSAGNVRLAESRFDYDGLGRLYKVHALHFGRTQSPVGDGEATTTFAYAPNGACTSVTDDLGLVTSFDYDTVGRPRLKSAAVVTRVLVRDRAGNVTSVTETNVSSFGGPAQVFACSYAYDSLGRLVSCTDGAGNTTSCAYDSLGHVVRVTDALGNDTTCAYDFMGDCLACASYSGSSSLPPATVLRSRSAAYDSSLRCVSATDANGNTTGYAYDTLGNCTLVTRPDGTQQRLVWSPRSNLQQATDPNGTVSVCTYDLNDRLVRRDITMGGGGGGGAVYVEVFSFDGCDRLVSHHDDDCDGAFAYDSLAHCVSETLNGLTTSSTYDALGNRLSLTYPGGRALAYAYDTASRCTGITESGQALAGFEYIGSCLSKETCGNGVSSQFAYDGLVGTPNAPDDHGFGQVRQIRHTLANGSIVLSGCKVTWDQKQNKGARTVAIPGAGGRTNDMLFAYDALDQLVQSAVLDGTTVLRTNTYGFDRMGNRTNVTGPTCSGDYLLDGSALAGLLDFQMNQYTATPCEARSYDANGNLVGRTSGTGSALSYTYDYDDRLVAVQSVVDDGTGSTTITPVASYTYDALGRRTSKTVYSGGLPPATRQYCYDGTCAIEERQNGAVVQSFVHATGLTDQIRENDTVVFEVRQGTQEYFVHPDDQGNALALTGANGAVVERYDYDDYGAVTFLTSDGTPTSATSSAVGYPYCWGGLRLDPETGLLNDDGSGYLDPQTGRDIGGEGCIYYIKGAYQIRSIRSGGSVSDGNNPWSGGGGGGGTEMKNGTVKFFNNPKGFGMVVGGSGKKHTKTGHVTLMK